ncbi:Pimeloyl-ACP methyl ester carboxylesterase [Shimia gijangensis]|uniref:Pimeloyl-ACP methyl ester carboxylesterase n=1 Tax=Shimia gijangensis TaxID=1470563 RepID=A0A1M6GSD5_9RHOB|nr:alpha/beta hydrolase [Shimia gijangensis]SHJ12863.1 Pimeloyl-ACP methyl ester carboxylesterase [Shimia gijangensis]
MITPRHEFIAACGHEIHVTLWGDPAAKPIVMWHGLARTGRDFDELAGVLGESHFVLCPDTFGRGLSSWSVAPETDYSVAHMADTAEALLDHFDLNQTGWLGTSMGGLIGMYLASDHRAERLNYLIINDIGPEVPQDAVDRILTYAADLPVFASFGEAETWLRTVYAPFGEAPDDFWRRMTLTSLRRRDDGMLTLHYDPQIIRQFDCFADELNSWDRYARISLPTHVLAGAYSDILTTPILERMCTEGPLPQVSVFDNCGHAPALASPEDIDFLCSVIDRLESREHA